MTPVMIAGESVDLDDPCAVCARLKAYRLQIATGGAVEEIELRSPVSSRRVRYTKASSPADLDLLIGEYGEACAALVLPKKRTRYAIRGTFRPY